MRADGILGWGTRCRRMGTIPLEFPLEISQSHVPAIQFGAEGRHSPRAVSNRSLLVGLHCGARRPLQHHLPLRDEARDACFHHRIQPLSSLNATYFVQRSFRNSGDVEIFLRAGQSFRRGKYSRAALYRPCQ